MSHACTSHDQRDHEPQAHDQDWNDDALSGHVPGDPVNNHPAHRARPEHDDEEE